MLGQSFGADVRAIGRDERQAYLAVPGAGHDLGVAREGHKLGLEHVALVARLVLEHDATPAPVPDAHAVVVRAGEKERACLVEVEGIDAAVVLDEAVRLGHAPNEAWASGKNKIKNSITV